TAKGIQLIALAPAELRSAELTAQWEQQLAQISQGQVKADAFVADMRAFAARLVSEVKNSTSKYVPDNVSRTACPQCGQYLLDTNGKSGRQLVCPDRECGYRQTLSRTTNARCPNCHKKLELRGEGDARSFVCICGFREKLAEFEKKKAAAGAGKREVQQYLNREAEALTNTALAEQLAKWKQNH
ncbi:MAG: DNA topoisomerase III, partial [Syntrophomonadaceae bacterium]|nr:DNA topoisomerase III [Syntrophomonadaceae bacterium]